MPRPPSPPPRFLIGPVQVAGGQLWLGEPEGTRPLYPLYRFGPARLARHSGQGVPFASDWPEYLKPFVYRYWPLPALGPGQWPLDLAGAFGVQARPERGLRPWAQATFRGWPLYVCSPDLAADAPCADLPDLFSTVPITLPPLPARLTGLSGNESPGSGP